MILAFAVISNVVAEMFALTAVSSSGVAEMMVVLSFVVAEEKIYT